MQNDSIFLSEVKDFFHEIHPSLSAKVMEIYNAKDFFVDEKKDGSPVTQADLVVNDILREKLTNKFPDIPILSEENTYPKEIPSLFWLIDPLDGTKEFINRSGEFTINVALVKNTQSIFGYVAAPAIDEIWLSEGQIFKESQKKSIYSDSIVIVKSRSHSSKKDDQFEQFLENKGIDYSFLSVGSSLKICMLATNNADLYIRFGPTSEWDIAAANAVLEAYNGGIYDLHTKKKIIYGKADSVLNPSFFAISNRLRYNEIVKLVDEFSEKLL